MVVSVNDATFHLIELPRLERWPSSDLCVCVEIWMPDVYTYWDWECP